MMNSRELEQIETLEPVTRAKVKSIIEWSEGVLEEYPYRLSLPGFVDGYPCFRTEEQQYRLYLKGRPELPGGSKGGKVTWKDGKTSKSYHQTGRAIDIGLRYKSGSQRFMYLSDCPEVAADLFRYIASKFQDEGFEWGDTWEWKDSNHFQLP